MHAKPCIIGCTLLLALSVSGVDHALSVTVGQPATAGHAGTALWKTIPEDATAWRREPFKGTDALKSITAPTTKQSSLAVPSELELQGIMKSNTHFYAIMSGRTVKTGDHVEGWTIDSISRHRVTLHRKDEKQIYDIYQGRIDRGSR